MSAPKPNDNHNFRMIHGTEGRLDYLVVARRGDIVLAIKPNMVVDGEKYNGPEGTLYIGMRIRSAKSEGIFEEDDAILGTVVSLADKKLKPWNAWSIEWELKSEKKEYASTQAGLYLPGDPKKDTAFLDEALADQKMVKQITEAILELVGNNDYLVIPPVAIEQWLQAHFEKVFAKTKEVVDDFKKQKDAKKIDYEAKKAGVGVFGVHKDALKKMHDKFKQSEVEDADPDDEDPDDEDNDENDE